VARKKVEDLQKHTLNLRAGDMKKLEELFPRFGASVMVRKIVSKFIDQTSQVPENKVPTKDLSL
jgi:hypothetical protein